MVELFPPGGSPVRVRRRDDGVPGPWPEGLGEPACIVTAWNPRSMRLDPLANARRQGALVAELAERGLAWWPAVGWDPASDHREDSVVVAGLGEDEAVALGRRHGQEAVYVWTRRSWAIVSCVDGRRVEGGWTLEVPDDPVHPPCPNHPLPG